MGRPGFENLVVYRIAEKLADHIWDFALNWPNLARDTVGRQVIRAADSIGANIAEGVGRFTYKENRHFVRVARGSLYETQHWLRRAFRRRLLTQKQIDSLKAILDSYPARLNAYYNSIGKNKS
jgi:four helix bundle protein